MIQSAKLIIGTIALILLALIILASINGCSDTKTQSASAHEHEAVNVNGDNRHLPILAVVGLDITGSYKSITRQALKICTRIVKEANPSDEYVIRTISGQSYPPMTRWKKKDGSTIEHKNTIAHIKFTTLPKKPNRFNKQTRQRYALAYQQFAQQKQEIVETLEHLTFQPAPTTDIYGFLEAANDLFVNAPANTRKVLMIASDLVDTRGYECHPDLTGVEVVIFQFLADADPAKSRKHREKWIADFTAWGATHVKVQPAN